MIRLRGGVGGRAVCGALTVCAAAAAGCSTAEPPTVRIGNPWLGKMRVAVAPALNFSGSPDVDGLVVADVMAAELHCVEGFEVLPVSRVLAVLSRQGLSEIESAAHALEVCDVLGAEAILVFAVTEYDPYEPPVVGITAQLYGPYAGDHVAGLDPVLVSRSASPLSERRVAPADEPLAQVSRIFNAGDEPVAREVKEFAQIRNADQSALGWRKYTASQRYFLRFCCHSTIRELVQRGVSHRRAAGP